jgi:hypothetical protein
MSGQFTITVMGYPTMAAAEEACAAVKAALPGMSVNASAYGLEGPRPSVAVVYWDRSGDGEVANLPWGDGVAYDLPERTGQWLELQARKVQNEWTES